MPIGIYKRTHPAWNKGKKMDYFPMLGRPVSIETRKKLSDAHKGYKHTDETKKKIGLANKKEWVVFKCDNCGQEKEKKYSHYRKNRRHTCSRKCYAQLQKIDQKGKNSHFWKGGVTPINKAIRSSVEYEEWRKKVFERDCYICQHCGKIGGYLQADHIKPFALYPELRFDIDNSQTLCIPCHKMKTYRELLGNKNQSNKRRISI